MKTQIKALLLFGLIGIFGVFSSCTGPEENPDLVNPPLVSPTVGVRYLNLSGDGENRTLVMNFETPISDIPFGQMSPFMNPPADSTYLTIEKNGVPDFQQEKPIKYIVRNINYTFVSLETLADKHDSLYRATDSIVYFQSTMVPPKEPTQAYLRLFNGMNNSAKYRVNYGCPNGKNILPALGYGDIQLQAKTIEGGEVPISIIKTKKNEDTVVGVYKLQLEPQMQYCILVIPNYDKSAEEIFIYNELSEEIEAVFPAEEIIEKTAEARIINMSYVPTDVKTGVDEIVAQSLKPLVMSPYSLVTACESQTSDELIFDANGDSDTTMISFEVLRRYSFVQIDSADVKGFKQITVPPVSKIQETNDLCYVRVINAYWKEESMTLSMGMRNTPDGIKTGLYLASRLPFGELGETNIIHTGRIPLTLFTATQPAHLEYTAVGEFEANKSYLLIIHADEYGNPQIAVIEDDEEDGDITFLEEGVFAQFVSTATDIEKVILNLVGNGENILVDSEIPQSSSVATILPVGDINIQADGISMNLTTEKGKRLLIVISGSGSDLKMYDFQYEKLHSGSDFYSRRFINATNDIDEIFIRTKEWNERGKDDPQNPIAYAVQGGESIVEEIMMDNKQAFFVYDAVDNPKESASIKDLIFSFNKAYSIVIGGQAAVKEDDPGYFVVIVQEY